MRRAAAIAVLALAAYASPGIAAVGELGYPGIRRRVPTSAAVALTFDDGPHHRGTPAILGQLEGLALTATFFLVGREVRKNPGLVREIVAAGHEPALHCDRHLPPGLMPPGWVMRDLRRARACIEDATGVRVTHLRAPFGAASLATLAFARRERLTVAGWSRWGRDWERAVTPALIAERLTSGLAGGDVLLMHDSDAYSAAGSWRRTAAALPLVAERIRAAGLAGVSLAAAGSG